MRPAAFEELLDGLTAAAQTVDVPAEDDQRRRLGESVDAALAELTGVKGRICVCEADRWHLCRHCGHVFAGGGNGQGRKPGCNPYKNVLQVARGVRAFWRRARWHLRTRSLADASPRSAAASGDRPRVTPIRGAGADTKEPAR